MKRLESGGYYMFDYKRIEMMIKERTAKIAVWGCGFVGTTNLFYLTKQGFNCVDTLFKAVVLSSSLLLPE